MIAKWLIVFLPSLISKSQSSLVLGRKITDNMLVAYKLVHYLKSKKWGKTWYEQGIWTGEVELSREGTNYHGFCLAFLLFDHGLHVNRVIFNSCQWQPKGTHITPSCGLRQGDLLSSYLFLLCTEGLISLLTENQRVKGLKICRGAPIFNHLLFADNSVLFCKADVDTTRRCNKWSKSMGKHLDRE